MKKILCIIAMVFCTFALFAQETKIPQMLELVQIEENDVEFEVVNIPQDGQNHYWFNVGTMGFGDQIFQIQLDPLSHLYIPLGDTLAEAISKMEELQDLFNGTPGTSLFVDGCLTMLYPNDKLEQVKVSYYKPLLTRKLEFSIQQEDFLRAAYISRSNFNTLLKGLNFYQKIHPNE